MFHFSIAKYLRFVLSNHPAAFRLHVTQKRHMTSRVIMSDFWERGFYVSCYYIGQIEFGTQNKQTA